MSMATLRAARVQEPLRVGDPLPTLEGQLLTGREAVLPQAASGKVTLVAIGFTYQSRLPVEAWADWHRKRFGLRAQVLTSFADGHRTEADHDPAHRRREP